MRLTSFEKRLRQQLEAVVLASNNTHSTVLCRVVVDDATTAHNRHFKTELPPQAECIPLMLCPGKDCSKTCKRNFMKLDFRHKTRISIVFRFVQHLSRGIDY